MIKPLPASPPRAEVWAELYCVACHEKLQHGGFLATFETSDGEEAGRVALCRSCGEQYIQAHPSTPVL